MSSKKSETTFNDEKDRFQIDVSKKVTLISTRHYSLGR